MKTCHACGKERRLRLSPFCNQKCAAAWALAMAEVLEYCRQCGEWFDRSEMHEQLTHSIPNEDDKETE